MSLDVFRGITIAAMILVSTPGTWENVYTPLDHALWHGWTPTDLVFPFLLFAMGAAVQAGLKAGDEIVSGSFGVIARTLKDGLAVTIDKPKPKEEKK